MNVKKYYLNFGKNMILLIKYKTLFYKLYQKATNNLEKNQECLLIEDIKRRER